MRRPILLAALIVMAVMSFAGAGAHAQTLVAPLDPHVIDAPPGGDGDGAFEPGESADVTQPVGNLTGLPLTNLSGTLTEEYGVTVPQPQATWPELGATDIVDSAPPFRVGLTKLIPCGLPVDLDLGIASDQGTERVPLSFVAGMGPYAYSDDRNLPREIATKAVHSSTLRIEGPGTVRNLRVRFQLDHPFLGDVGMTLTSPAGTTVTLMDGPGAGLWGLKGGSYKNLVLTDDAETFVADPWQWTSLTRLTHRPEEPLSEFDGEPKAGLWTLRTWDRFEYADDGYLRNWGIAPVGVECSTSRNDGPTARWDAYRATAGEPLHGASVLANDTDPDGDPLVAVLGVGPQQGTVELAADGTFTYTPEPGYVGKDWFRYRAEDGNSSSISTPVRITVDGPNVAPITSPASYNVFHGRLTRGYIFDWVVDRNDDPLTFELTGRGEQVGEIKLAPDGSFAYWPPHVASALHDSFEYRVTDGKSPPLVERVYFWVYPHDGGPPQLAPPPSIVTPKSTKALPESRAFASFAVQRVARSGKSLKVRARMSKLATGSVRASFRAGASTSSARATIAAGAVSFRLPLSARQRRASTGVLKLSYAGDTRTRPERVSVNTGRRVPGLRTTRAVIDGNGMLRVAGAIGRRARGVVRVHLTYSPRAGVTKVYDYKAKIRGGKWSMRDALPAEAVKAPGQVTIRYGGDRARGLAGAHVSRDVGG